MIILSIAIALAFKSRLKGNYKSFELEIGTKQKNCPPVTKDSPNQKSSGSINVSTLVLSLIIV